MFESLEEHIKHDDEVETTKSQRWLTILAALVGAGIILGGLYFGVRLLE